MSDKMSRMFEENRSNPFQFKHVTLCHSLADLAQVREPKAVLASMSDMECGYSRDLFVQWASNPKNSIILTSRTAPGCLTHTLVSNLKLPSVDLEVRKRVCLEGEELEAFKVKDREEKLAKEPSENMTIQTNCSGVYEYSFSEDQQMGSLSDQAPSLVLIGNPQIYVNQYLRSLSFSRNSTNVIKTTL
jgi:Cft2 family RNA processing exonuclease